MKLLYKLENTASYRCLTAMLLSLFPLIVFGDVKASSVFNTEQGFLPQEYLTSLSYSPQQSLPQNRPPCPQPFISEDFQVSGSVLESFQDGRGIVYQSLFNPKFGISAYSRSALGAVHWVGDLRALMIDEAGRLRSDNGDKILGTLQEDPLISACFDPAAGVRRFRLSWTANSRQPGSCTALNYAYADKDIGYLWRASDGLSEMSDTDAAIQRKPFQYASKRRYIRTHIDQQEYDFVATSDYPFKAQWFGSQSATKARQLINYVRGQEHKDLRSRSMDQQVWRLGDTLQSQPVHVGQPSANFHLLYADESYQDFVKQYRDRRSRIFLSSHDGMLHAFNAGWYDPQSKQIQTKTKASLAGRLTQWSLGQELWAFVPFDILPLLSERARKSYAKDAGQHLPVLSQTPYVFDARIFNSQGVSTGLDGQADRVFTSADGTVLSRQTHPGGWGSLMVVGFGYGGGVFSVEDAQGLRHQFKPAYLLFDITDAEQAPRLLAVIQHEDLGGTLSLPSAYTVKNHLGNLEWYLALGSGADPDPQGMRSLSSSQNAKLFLLKLRSLQQDLKAGKVQPIDLAAPASYVGGISAADWNLDGETEALYVTTVGYQPNSAHSRWTGALFRVSTTLKVGLVEKLLALNAPLAYRAQLSIDPQKNRWIYLASGRLAQSNDYRLPAQNSIIGLKETRLPSGEFIMETAKASVSKGMLTLNELIDVSALQVDSQTGELSGPLNLSPALARPHVLELEQRLMQYRDASNYAHGWNRVLANNEIASAQGLLYGGMFSQPTYQLDSVACQVSGKAYVHNLRFTTGTAWFDALSVQGQAKPRTQKPSAALSNTKSSALSTSVLAGYLLQVQPEHSQSQANVLISDQNGHIERQETSFLEHLISGEISWREL